MTPLELTDSQVLRPLTWHTASVNAPVWVERNGKLVPGIVRSLGHKRVLVVDDAGKERCRPYAEVYWRKDEKQASNAARTGRAARRA